MNFSYNKITTIIKRMKHWQGILFEYQVDGNTYIKTSNAYSNIPNVLEQKRI